MVSRSWRERKFEKERVCKGSIGYDDNTLCLSTMLREMRCGKERVMHYRNSAGAAPMLTGRLKPRTWFESVEVDIKGVARGGGSWGARDPSFVSLFVSKQPTIFR